MNSSSAFLLPSPCLLLAFLVFVGDFLVQHRGELPCAVEAIAGRLNPRVVRIPWIIGIASIELHDVCRPEEFLEERIQLRAALLFIDVRFRPLLKLGLALLS